MLSFLAGLVSRHSPIRAAETFDSATHAAFCCALSTLASHPRVGDRTKEDVKSGHKRHSSVFEPIGGVPAAVSHAAGIECGGLWQRKIDGTRHVRWMSTSKGRSGDDDHGQVETARIRSDHRHCVELVQSRDIEGYLCGLLMPPKSRGPYFALRAFNVELASVKDGGGLAATRPRHRDGSDMDSSLASRMRLQWWRDAVAEMYEDLDGDGSMERFRGRKGGVEAEDLSVPGFLSAMFASSRSHSPVVRELRRAVQDAGLTRRFLIRLIDAREADLDIRHVSTMRDLVQYGEDVQSTLLYLALECVGVRDDSSDGVASHVGVGLGITTALRSAVERAGMGELSVPEEVMDRHGASRSYLMSPPKRDMGEELSDADRESDEALRNVVKEMAFVAGSHLFHARWMQSSVPKEGRAALLPAVGALNYLKKLESVDFDILHADLMAKEGLPARLDRLRVTFSLGRAWLTGVF